MPLLRWRSPSTLILATLMRHVAPFCSTAAQQLPKPPKQQFVVAPHPSTIAEKELLKECDIKPTRGSGPGGQHRNKVQTGVEIKHLPTAVSGKATESRSAATNRKAAISRLRVRLAVACRTEQQEAEDALSSDGDAALAPSSLWKGRVKAGKLAISESHSDFPAILCEALDRIMMTDKDGQRLDVKGAGAALGVSTSQMIKLLAKEQAALQLVNTQRASEGAPPLRANRK